VKSARIIGDPAGTAPADHYVLLPWRPDTANARVRRGTAMRGIFDCPGCGSGIPIPAATARVVRCSVCGATIGLKFVDDPSKVTANTWTNALLEDARDDARVKAAKASTAAPARDAQPITARDAPPPPPPSNEDRPRKRAGGRARPAKSGSSMVLIAV